MTAIQPHLVHTPGPWLASQSPSQRDRGCWGIGLHVESDTGYANGCDYTEDGRPYMLVSGICSEADARLIAAAPDMLEALRRIAQLIDCGCVPCTGQCRTPIALECEVEERQELARSAIAKAVMI